MLLSVHPSLLAFPLPSFVVSPSSLLSFLLIYPSLVLAPSSSLGFLFFFFLPLVPFPLFPPWFPLLTLSLLSFPVSFLRLFHSTFPRCLSLHPLSVPSTIPILVVFSSLLSCYSPLPLLSFPSLGFLYLPFPCCLSPYPSFVCFPFPSIVVFRFILSPFLLPYPF